jgi:hypothetical protein
MTETRAEGDNILATWFRLRDQMMREGLPAAPTALRPPSLREACYAYALAARTLTETTPETIECFVNGLELGAMAALRAAWEARQ